MHFGPRHDDVVAFLDSLGSVAEDALDKGVRAIILGVPRYQALDDEARMVMTHYADIAGLVDQLRAAKTAAKAVAESFDRPSKQLALFSPDAAAAIVVMDHCPFDRISIAFRAFRYTSAVIPVRWE